MKYLKVLLLILAAALIIWIDLPENMKIGNVTLNPLHLNFNIGGFQIEKEFKTHLGLDLKGGSHLVFDADTSKVPIQDVEDAISSAKDIIERRVNFYGVSEPTVQTVKSGNNHRIVVDLPGINNTAEAVRLIGQTAQLTFAEQKEEKVGTESATVFKPTELGGGDIKKAQLAFNPETGEPQVALSFSNEGIKKFSDITERNVGKPLAILLDNSVLSAPIVNQHITDGNAVISGQFTVDEAKKFAIAINSGALPLPIKLVEQRNIGATLGDIEVKKSMVAGFVGLFLVILFMVLYYKSLGFIAALSLIIYGLLTLAIFRTIPVVLTLSGLAGFILSIGMAVDANILIFERIKEEMRKGRDFDVAVQLGFGRAIDAIKDANITTLLVAFILFNPFNWDFLPQFGLVRGFALTLAIGVMTSLFTGIFITRRLIRLFYKA